METDLAYDLIVSRSYLITVLMLAFGAGVIGALSIFVLLIEKGFTIYTRKP